ncbi:MAG: hypothetical protein PSX36_02645 [bacterium]|nr:hypothetical protein [bacterium]
MNSTSIIYLISVFLLFASFELKSQAVKEQTASKNDFYKHRISVLMANSHIPTATNSIGDKSYLVVPTWGLDYDYSFTRNFGMGMHSDIVLQQYKIEEQGDHKIIERSFPVAVNLVGLYKPIKKLSVVFGGGMEFEKTENFKMLVLGLEYGIELPNQWELGINLLYERKIEIYDSWFFGMGFSKLFGHN